MKIKFPINWKPYTFQVPLWKYLMNGGRKAIAVWHISKSGNTYKEASLKFKVSLYAIGKVVL